MRLTAKDGSVSLQHTQHSATEPSHQGEERLTLSQVTNGSGIFEQFKQFTKNLFKKIPNTIKGKGNQTTIKMKQDEIIPILSQNHPTISNETSEAPPLSLDVGCSTPLSVSASHFFRFGVFCCCFKIVTV